MLLIILLSVFFGAVLTLVLEACIFYIYHYRQPEVTIPRNGLFEPAQMDKHLSNSSLLGKHESCNALNTLIAFLFREMKDTIIVRTWIIKKMNVEFDELLRSKTAGRLLEQIKVRDYCLGPTFPTIKDVVLCKATPREPCVVPEEVDVAVEIEYGGGFRVTVDVDLAFGTSAYISVTVKKLRGRARLQFTRIPYSHWSFSFYDEPEIEFEVKSHFEGRTFPQLGSLIVNQLKKTLKKKHTLPNYKMRYKPFFVKAVPPHANADMYLHETRLVVGKMTVVVIEGSRLAINNEDSEVYCTIAVDSAALKHEDIFRRYPGEVYEVEIQKNNKSIGVMFSSSPDESEVVIESIQTNSPASLTELKRGDVLLSINGIDVTSGKEAMKLIKNSKEKCKLRVQRPTQPIDTSVNQVDGRVEFVDHSQENDYDDFINDTITTLGYSTQDSLPKQVTAAAASLSESISPVLRRRAFPEGQSQHKRRASWGAMDSSMESYMDLKSESTHSLGTFLKESEKLTQLASKNQPVAREHTKNLPFNGLPSDPDADTISLASCPPDFLEDAFDAPTGETRPTQKKEDFQTSCMPASRDINWDELFEFDLDDSDKFLNVCIWNRVKGQLGERDIPIGYASVPLMNVALQCLTTLSGEHQEIYKLFPPQQKAGASRHPAYANLYRHSGFENNLCYGDITLGFHHSPLERQEFTLEEINAKMDELRSHRLESQNDLRQQPNVKKRTRPDELSLTSTKRHVFVGTQFAAQTRCGFCTKKVWTKYAYQCKVCKLICHKKCSEKTQAQMPCDILLGRPKSEHPSPARDIQLKVPASITPMPSPGNSVKNTPQTSPTSSPPGSPLNSPPTSDDEEDIDELVRSIHKLKGELRKLIDPGGTMADTDAMFMSAAREMGRELYIDLLVNERKEKLELMISKLQQEIDREAEKRAHLAQDQHNAKQASHEASVAGKILKSEQRMEDLRLLMIHYCAGMQHCNEAKSKD
ncbi:PDZ domain-containing protein 8-like [Anneissia japonica]|uniref:PDZ domain-containing protein 8-like n=1 Tax=Anneissia japonica TaxID=1529436 RepID=UPI0014256B66|nr:PDZ domain-containing protein 8-like [Anneissia japonica]